MKPIFIDENYIFKYTIVENNVDPDLITKFIIQGQDLNIQAAIGQNLYNKLLNDCPNFVEPYRTLIKEYIQPALAEWTVYHALPWINFRLTNKAVSQKSSDFSAPSTVDDLKWLRDQVRNNAEFYNERIKDYIKNNPASFPEFYQNTLLNTIRPNKSNYFSGIHTRGRVVNYPKPPYNNIDPCDECY